MPKLMTKEELVDTIAKWASDNVAKLVKTAVETEITPLRAKQTDWMERMLSGQTQASHATVSAEERGLRFGRIVRAGAATVMALRSGQVIPPEEILRRWGDKALADEIAEGRQQKAAMAAGDAGAGGFFVPPQYSQDVIEFLRARTVVRRLGARALPMPTGTIKIPKIAGGATAYYVGENTNATTSVLTAAQLTLSFKKLITMVPVSNDLIRYSSPGADAMVRDDTVDAMRVREDSAFIRDSGSDQAPKGLRYWAHPDHILTMTATPSIQKTFTDLGRLLQLLLDANIPMISPAWIMAPRTEMFLKTLLNSNGIPIFLAEMTQGRLLGFPYGSTTGVPVNVGTSSNKSELYLTDMAQVILGESLGLVIDASQEAAYHDGSAVQAAFSLDQSVVRAIAEHDLGVRHDKAIAVLTELTWAPGSV